LSAFTSIPDWQRRGVGTALLERGEATIAGGCQPIARVKATTSAQAFYERHGYRVVATLEHKTRGGLLLPCVALQKSIVTSR
jgi:putative acetyltransferase